MSVITAFDSKDFKRSTKIGDLKFYSPLGCGIRVTDPKTFASTYVEKMNNLLKAFGISQVCGCLACSEYFPSAGYSKTYRVSDELLKAIQSLIDTVYISYVILPSAVIPTVEVGGYRYPKRPINTFDFLRNLSTYFSYVTAWKYLGIESRRSEQILIDGFRGKITAAWEDIIGETKPKVYPHGDECNVYIATADMVASLTDKKLYDNHLRLTPEDITSIWKEYPFKVEVHFLDANILHKIVWMNDDLIRVHNYFAKPTIFLRADGYRADEIKKLSVYPEATTLARNLGGCVHGFVKETDTEKIKEGDIFVYAGTDAEANGKTLKDMYDIEIMPSKALKERIKQP